MTKAEELREAMRKAAVAPYPETVFLPVSTEEYAAVHQAIQDSIGRPIDAISADVIRRAVGPWMMEDVLRALTKTLGITREMVGNVGCSGKMTSYHRSVCWKCRTADVLTAILEATGDDA